MRIVGITLYDTQWEKRFLLAITVNCQLLRDEERPTRYVLPYSGLAGDEQDPKDEQHYYKPNRRAERIPATAYQYDEQEEEYYRPPQPPQPRPKVESENQRYQPTTPSHKDYEQILKNNHLARLRVAAKKQNQPQSQAPPQSQAQAQPVEQYLKEVNPTTKTTYQRPANYLRFAGQSALKQHEPNEENPALKQQSYRYVLQPDLQQQKPQYLQYQYESQQEPIKPVQPKTPHFNLVAYQNALIARQKLLAAESQDDLPPKSSIYVAQNVPKKTKKQKNTPSRQPATNQQYEYYTQPPPQRQSYIPESSPVATAVRYQQPLNPRTLYPKGEVNYQIEDTPLYPEQKEIEYQTQAPVRQTKQRTTTRLPRRKPKYQTEEPPEDYQPVPKYQPEEQFEYQPTPVKYQEEQAYRRPALVRQPPKAAKYEETPIDTKDDYLPYPPVSKYQREGVPRRQPPPQYQPEPEVRPNRYLSRQQYQDDSKQLHQYPVADLTYQPTVDIPVRTSGRGPSVSYRKTYPQYQQQFITPLQPKTRLYNSDPYQNVFIDQQQEESPIYITQNLIKKTSHPKTQITQQYKYTQRPTNYLKLTPIRYQPIMNRRSQEKEYEIIGLSQDYQQEQIIDYLPDITEIESSVPEFEGRRQRKPKTKKRTSYLNGQRFQQKITPLSRYEPEDLATQSSSNLPVKYTENEPFLILVYDD